MRPEPNASAVSPEPPLSLLTLALWAGFVTGFAEVAVLGKDLLGPRFCWCSQDVVWMVPVFDAALFGLVGGGLAVVARLARLPWRVAAGVLAGLGAMLVLFQFHRLHRLAGLVLALGVGVQVARLLANRVPAATRVVRRSLPPLILAVCIIAGAMAGWRAVRERRLAASRPAAARGAPNVLLLILDTVRAADLSLYGYARRTTPELERLAERGTVFDRAFAAASWTLPSHSSMFTGRWPSELEASWQQPLGLRWPLLAEALGARGYVTAAFVANDIYVGWESGLSRGFEHFDAFPVLPWKAAEQTGFGMVLYPPIRKALAPLLRRTPLLWRVRLPPLGKQPSADYVTRAFLSWYDRAHPGPLFAFLNFMDAHTPYTVPESFRYRFRSPILRPLSPEAFEQMPKQRLTPADLRPKLDAYDGSIAYLDSQLGSLFHELERRRLLDNTLVIITADHGEEFAEHGLVEHGNSLYRLSLHVPLLIWFPGHVPEGRRVDVPVSLRNLAATVLELVAPGEPAALPGRSLARFWAGAAGAPDTIFASVRQEPNQPDWYPTARGDLNSIAFGGWRYIRNEGDGGEELYDFEHDLLERWNLVGMPAGDRMLPHYRAALSVLVAGTPGTSSTSK